MSGSLGGNEMNVNGLNANMGLLQRIRYQVLRNRMGGTLLDYDRI